MKLIEGDIVKATPDIIGILTTLGARFSIVKRLRDGTDFIVCTSDLTLVNKRRPK